MSRLKDKDYTYFTTVRGMCRQCRRITPSRVFFRNHQVWQQSLCPTCANEPALIAFDEQWYLDHILQAFPNQAPLPKSHPPKQGCPFDCGPCAWHATPCQLPIFSITNTCNLRCPICFTFNRTDAAWHMSLEEVKKTVDCIIQSSGAVDLINITGGEPTLHPRLIEVLKACLRPEIGRLTMNSNGLRLAEDYALCQQLADLNICVILSFNTFDAETSRLLHGAEVVAAKQQAIENLSRAGTRFALLNVLIRGVNESVPGRLLNIVATNENCLSLTVQTMTYTGQGGGSFPNRRHIPVDEAARMICAHSNNLLHLEDFMPRPSAHPLCYAISYLFRSEKQLIPFTRFLSTEQIQQWLKESYLIHPADDSLVLREVINRLYAERDTENLRLFRQMVESIYPPEGELGLFERQRRAEKAVRTVYIHAHMDEDNFDCSRAMLCPDQVPVGHDKLIPACTYNLFYRMRDSRFFADSDSPSLERPLT